MAASSKTTGSTLFRHRHLFQRQPKHEADSQNVLPPLNAKVSRRNRYLLLVGLVSVVIAVGCGGG